MCFALGEHAPWGRAIVDQARVTGRAIVDQAQVTGRAIVDQERVTLTNYRELNSALRGHWRAMDHCQLNMRGWVEVGTEWD